MSLCLLLWCVSLLYRWTYSFMSLALVTTLCPSISGRKCYLYRMKTVHSVLLILFYVTCVIVISRDCMGLVTRVLEEEENPWHLVGKSTNKSQCNGQCSYPRSSTIPEAEHVWNNIRDQSEYSQRALEMNIPKIWSRAKNMKFSWVGCLECPRLCYSKIMKTECQKRKEEEIKVA